MLLLAIDKAGEDNKEKVADELKKLDVQTMIGRGKFGPSIGGTLNQAFSDVVVHQRVKGADAILFPKGFQTTDKVEPASYAR
jgi:branched-chain amino acid transport system substrate-binding protein